MCKRKENLCTITGICGGCAKEKEDCHVLSQVFEEEKGGLLRTKLQEKNTVNVTLCVWSVWSLTLRKLSMSMKATLIANVSLEGKI